MLATAGPSTPAFARAFAHVRSSREERCLANIAHWAVGNTNAANLTWDPSPVAGFSWRLLCSAYCICLLRCQGIASQTRWASLHLLRMLFRRQAGAARKTSLFDTACCVNIITYSVRSSWRDSIPFGGPVTLAITCKSSSPLLHWLVNNQGCAVPEGQSAARAGQAGQYGVQAWARWVVWQ